MVARTVGLGILATALGAMAAQPERQPISPGSIAYPDMMATPDSTTIDCASTPFGMAAPVVRDYEAMLLLWGPNGKFIDEYRPSVIGETPPLQRVFRGNLATYRTLRKAVSADLNGNGKDEVVELLSDGSDVQIAVYERFPGPTAQLLSTWFFSEAAALDSFSLVAGDLDGSKDRQQEIALSWTIVGGANNGKVRVVVLQGNVIGQVAQAGNVAAASFLTSATNLTFPRLAVGDFLGQGRAQLLLAAYNQASGTASLDLLEFDNGNNPATITTALPALGNAMRGAHFDSERLDNVQLGIHRFFYDDGTFNVIQTDGGGFPLIEALEANGGDLVDTAADEVTLHVMFYDPSQAKHVLALRLLDFVTTRNGANAITSIALNPFKSSAFSNADSSVRLGTYPDPAPRFAATIADVDAIARKEIVTAIAGHDGNNGALFGPMVWSARKVFVRNTPDFKWQNLGINNDSKSVVAFTNASHGQNTSFEWNFGDGTGTSPDENPRHAYASNGVYSVSLTTTDAHGFVFTIPNQVTVTGSANAVAQYTGSSPPWLYLIETNPVFTGTSDPDFQYPTYGSDKTVVKLAVGDMNRDGLPEVVVAVNNDGINVDTHVFQRQADGSFGRSTMEENLSGVTNLELVLSDFDGDSLNAVLSGATGDCRSLVDTSVSSLTWMPPYFRVPQADARRFALYGKSTSTSTSTDERSESFRGGSISVWAGFDAEISVPVVAIKTLEVSAKVTVGAEYQTATGLTHGTENGYSIDESYSVGNDALSATQEALLVAQQNGSNCYSYNIVTAAGIVPGSMMRACEEKPAQKFEYGSGALDWNLLGTDAVPVHWVPMQRDWASLALFHVPQARSGTGTPITFTSGHGADKATDGFFDTAAESGAATDKPYLEVDLGYVRDIESIRVFPSADGPPSVSQPLNFRNAVPDLWGFRLYASATPFSGSDLPSAAVVTTFVPGGISTLVQDTGAEAVYRYWNVWTLSGAEPLRARYLRLQKPGSGNIRIAEIQVFGNTHSEPQFYPEAVCDPAANDGLFLAYVFDSVNRLYRNIQVRGDMVWTGAVDMVNNVAQPTGVPGCVNDVIHDIRQGPIWQGTAIAGSAETAWNLNSDQTHTDSTAHSTEWSAHVGAEFEVKLGVGVMAVAGAAAEVSTGLTTENQSGTSVGTGFQLGGEIGGFAPFYASTCAYHPRPYNFVLKEYSNAGFLQTMNVTDYVVSQKLFVASNAWQREAVPARCSDNYTDDLIFADGFGF